MKGYTRMCQGKEIKHAKKRKGFKAGANQVQWKNSEKAEVTDMSGERHRLRMPRLAWITWGMAILRKAVAFESKCDRKPLESLKE